MTKEQTTNKCIEKIISDKFVENLKFQYFFAGIALENT
jgi:hypothetical protein